MYTFRSYSIVSSDSAILYVDAERHTEEVKRHLKSEVMSVT